MKTQGKSHVTKSNCERTKELFAASCEKLAWPFGLWAVISFFLAWLTIHLKQINQDHLANMTQSFVTPTGIFPLLVCLAAIVIGLPRRCGFISRLAVEMHNICQNVLGAGFGAIAALTFIHFIEVGELVVGKNRIVLIFCTAISVFLGALLSYCQYGEEAEKEPCLLCFVNLSGIVALAFWLSNALHQQ